MQVLKCVQPPHPQAVIDISSSEENPVPVPRAKAKRGAETSAGSVAAAGSSKKPIDLAQGKTRRFISTFDVCLYLRIPIMFN